MGLLLLLDDVLTLVILLYLQPHLSHDVLVNILLKSCSCDSFFSCVVKNIGVTV